MKKYIITLCLLGIVAIPITAKAEHRFNSFEVSPMVGWFLFEYEDINDAPVYGLRLGVNFTLHTALEFGMEWIPTEYDVSEDDFSLGLGHLSFVYNFLTNKFVPYAFIGGGIAHNRYSELAANKDQLFRYGAGLKYYVHEDIALRMELCHMLAFDKDYHNDYWHLGEATIGATFLFGGQAKDSDMDGVPDKKDECPNTPAMVLVDEKGCPLDTDGDGIFDGLDKCPETPEGALIDDNGCPSDSDADGVLDGLDDCPDSPPGQEVNEKGCPMDSDGDGVNDPMDDCPGTETDVPVDEKGCPKDSDNDGVHDGIDKCPDTAPGVEIDADGCEVLKEQFTLEGVNFESGSAELTPDSLAVLDRLARVLKHHSEVIIEIQGHTDSLGPDGLNLRLSEERAMSVMEYLVTRGISAERLKVKGYGEVQPIATNSTPEGRAQNRRVDVVQIHD